MPASVNWGLVTRTLDAMLRQSALDVSEVELADPLLFYYEYGSVGPLADVVGRSSMAIHTARFCNMLLATRACK